jgi:hypothetical protein
MKILGRILGAAAVISLLAGPAWAQSVPRYGEPDKEKSATEKAAERDAERAYKRSLGNIPEQKSTDPWGTVRSDNSAAKADKAAPAKPKAKSADTKTGASAK